VVERVHRSLDASSAAMSAIAEMVSGLESDQSTLSHSVSEQTQVITDVSHASSNEARGVAEIVEAMRRLNDSAHDLDRGGA
jgi:methyl-accepting chemotaxis protein